MVSETTVFSTDSRADNICFSALPLLLSDLSRRVSSWTGNRVNPFEDIYDVSITRHTPAVSLIYCPLPLVARLSDDSPHVHLCRALSVQRSCNGALQALQGLGTQRNTAFVVTSELVPKICFC